ncbi:MAG: NUDIX domain-containing protein [Actinomyces sp.]|uniref:NUDIX hydrolase n=1 Tax=Actinomyces sp. TaxID=29317 RepID=UPI0026DC58AC|nr:NUDIX domain-containing protein [Actinomyces sp.]MDO4243268.1 NUDIX domain-containing protein [Actinomyces sp.]
MAPSRFTLVPAAYVFLLREGGAGPETLLQLRRDTGYMDGYWACGVAGHVEPGESVLTTAVREATEEVGAVIEAADLEPLTTMHRTGDPGGAALEQRVDFFFTVRRWSGTLQVREPDKSAGLRWFALSALPELVPPHERHVLGRLAAALDTGEPVPAVIAFGF